MEFTVEQIAGLIQGKVEGESQAKVHTVAKIEEGHAGALSFLANPKYTEFIYTTKATAVIVQQDFQAEQDFSCTLIRVEDPYACFAKLLEIYDQQRQQKTGIAETAVVHETASLGENLYIGEHAVIGEHVVIENGVKLYPGVVIGDNVRIGANSKVYANAVVYHDCAVGQNCTIHSGAIIGGDGFGFAPNSANNYKKVPQIGNVILEDYVEIGANTTVDRATLGSTVIRKGVKLDNLIQVAHNVEIGENTVIAAQTGIAGSTKIGANCMIGGQVGIVGHLKLADGVKIAAQSGVGHSIEKEGEIIQGSPAFGIGDYKRSYVGFRKLPKLMEELEALKKEIEALKSQR